MLYAERDAFDYHTVPADTTKPSARIAFLGGKTRWTSAPVVAELLERNQCANDPECDGPEVAAGPVIYAVDVDRYDGDKAEMSIRRDLNTLAPSAKWYDGYTALADLNHDGLPEIVVAARRDNTYGVYAWNRNGLVKFFPYPENTPFSGGLPCIANVFDDRKAGFAQDYPEIIAASQNRMTCFNLNAATANPAAPWWWSVPTADSLGILGVTAFDFNADGLSEPVLRDAQHLRVLYGGSLPLPPGVDAERNLLKISAPCSPQDEHPVVADCNGDGAAEIIFTSVSPGKPVSDGLGRLTVLTSAGQPWANARPVWSQFGSHPGLVFDDLKPPIQNSQHWKTVVGGKRPYNSFNAQTPRFDKDFEPTVKAPDVLVDVDSFWCGEEKFYARLRICNAGNWPTTDSLPIKIFNDDPFSTAATAVGPARWLTARILPGACVFEKIEIPAVSGTLFYGIAGDDGTLPTPYGSAQNLFTQNQRLDCNPENNFFNLFHVWQTPALNLGPDLVSCSATAVPLDAGAGFSKYRWHDGSQTRFLTAAGPGKYWVEVWDACGFRQTDTLTIRPDTTLRLELAADTVVCPGTTLTLTATGSANFPGLSWWPPSCPGCPSVSVTPSVSTTYIVSGISGDCVAADSQRVWVAHPPGVQFSVNDAHPGVSDGSVHLSVSGDFGPFSFVWNTTPPATSPNLDSIPAGIYFVTVSNVAGCSTVVQIVVGEIVSTDEAGSDEQFSVVPNPANRAFEVHLNLPQAQHCQLLIFDPAGRLVFEKSFFENSVNLKIDCENWSSGAYRVVLRRADGRWWVRPVSVLKN